MISQGLSGEELLTRFKETRKKIRPAVEGLIAEAELAANEKSEHTTYDDVFGIVLAGTRDNFYEELKRYMKSLRNIPWPF